MRQDKRIVSPEAELARHRPGRAAAILDAIRTHAGNGEMDDREFREFVRRLVG